MGNLTVRVGEGKNGSAKKVEQFRKGAKDIATVGNVVEKSVRMPRKSYCLCSGVLVFLYRKACYENNGLFGLYEHMVIIVQFQIDSRLAFLS
jgi:hypothetical protein